ncbi:hypothetical protein U1Q18_018791 [Sarracenia purpurea var. burkii]
MLQSGRCVLRSSTCSVVGSVLLPICLRYACWSWGCLPGSSRVSCCFKGCLWGVWLPWGVVALWVGGLLYGCLGGVCYAVVIMLTGTWSL